MDYIACNFFQISCQLITMGQFAHWRINLVTSGCFNGIITINTVDALVSWQNYRLLPLLRSLFGEEEPPICTQSCYCSTTMMWWIFVKKTKQLWLLLFEENLISKWWVNLENSSSNKNKLFKGEWEGHWTGNTSKENEAIYHYKHKFWH